MKKTIRFTAAALAAILTMSCAAAAAYAESDEDLSSDTGYTAMLSGGWQTNDGSVALSKNPEAKAAFKKATKGLLGVKYEALALLGTQIVAGTNYAILCRSTVVYPDAQPQISVMYIYEDLQGNTEILGFQTIIGEQLMGGFTANDGKLGIKNNEDVYKTYKKAMKGLTGVSYSPLAYLGSQVVAGTNYMVLCRSRVVYPDAPCQWSLVTVNKDLKGKASLVDTETLELGISNIDGEDTEEEANVQTANPWSQYETAEEAAQAAGVEFSAPEKLGNHEMTCIRAMEGLVDITYTKGDGENEICVRKGLGTDDISGDYNVYKNVTKKKINGFTVTLKGSGSGYKAAVWTDGDNSYAVLSDRSLSEKFMKSIITKIS